MTAADVVKRFLESLVEVEVAKVLPLAANLIPGIPGKLTASLLSTQAVQDKLKAFEDKEVDAAVDWAAKEFDVAKGWVESHTKGALHDAVEEVLNASPPAAAHLTAADVRAIALLTAAGKFQDALKSALGALGLPVPA